MKRIFPLLLIFILIAPSAEAARVDLPKLNPNHYFVQDNAEVLTSETINELNELGTHLEKGTSVEMLLLTMPSTGQEHRQDFALRALREYGVGKKEKDNGIVIFFNNDNNNEFNNRGIDVQVGYEIEGYLNDAKIGKIIDDYALEDAKRGDYDKALKNLYKALYEESLNAYGYDEETGEFTNEQPEETSNDDEFYTFLFNTLVLVIVIAILFYIMNKNNRGGPPRGGRRRPSYRRSGTPIFFPSGRSGGGFSGGSGGFGGFGGGSGGGGGAGRGF